jgi:hypothetical protein
MAARPAIGASYNRVGASFRGRAMNPTRRRFLSASAATGALAGLGDFSFLGRLPRVSAAEAKLNPNAVRLQPEIEPLVRLLEETPRERLLEEVGQRVRTGQAAYRDVLAALLLAGVRNVQPRPVGFKFHAVLVVNSAHLASLASPESDRWLPIFWALDYFKDSQARDAAEGDWTLANVDEARVPAADQSATALAAALDDWDVEATDVAAAGLARSAKPAEAFELLCRYGARDFRDIGHKAIYVANSFRTLEHIGWQHGEPVLRSLAYALLAHEGDNPAKRDADADRPWRLNQERAAKINPGWQQGADSADATGEMLKVLRQGSPDDACDTAVALLNRGASPQSLWDAVLDGAGELLMRRPGIVALHAVTTANAMHFAFRTAQDDTTRRLLLLQNAAFSTMFRGALGGNPDGTQIDQLEPVAPKAATGPDALAEIFADVTGDKPAAAGKVLAYLRDAGGKGDGDAAATALMDAARRLLFRKGDNAHDYKFSAAVLEDYRNVSPAWRDRFLASSVYMLRGSGDGDNALVQRVRAAVG